MNKLYLLLIACTTILLSCKKGSNSTTSNNTTTVVPTSVEAYTVDGIQDVLMNSTSTVSMPITLEYHDSVQQTVSVSISGAPLFLFCGTSTYTPNGYITSTGPWTGIPTYSIPLQIYFLNNASHPYVSGTYPITITCTSTLSGTKTFTFNIIAQY